MRVWTKILTYSYANILINPKFCTGKQKNLYTSFTFCFIRSTVWVCSDVLYGADNEEE